MDSFDTNGFELLPSVVTDEELNKLQNALSEHEMSGPGLRHLLTRNETIRQFASSSTLLEIAKRHLGSLAKPVKAILFDKTVESNWYVTWHQDLTIAVREKIEQSGFGPWSLKDGVQHVQPPVAVLENMIAIRIHLDPCSADNGAISFIPGSHKSGKLNADEIQTWREKQDPTSCSADKGDVIIMRPLILHSSGKASKPEHRRVLHIEYTGVGLPGGLIWSEGAFGIIGNH